jgi:hypothetical protein
MKIKIIRASRLKNRLDPKFYLDPQSEKEKKTKPEALNTDEGEE